jgi:hypothetical protein
MLSFSSGFEYESVRLLEIPDAVALDHLLAGRAEIRAAGPDDTVVLTTPNQSYDIKLVESTNSLMLLHAHNIVHSAKHTMELVHNFEIFLLDIKLWGFF